MQRKYIYILAPIALAAAFSPALADGVLSMRALEISASVQPRPARQRLISLPNLDFAVELSWQCSEQQQSITLSVADTLQILNEDVLSGTQPVTATISVPARQLKLAAHPSFCVADDPQSDHELRVPGLATAHASLRCTGDSGQSVVFASAALPVTLACAQAPDVDQVSPADR